MMDGSDREAVLLKRMLFALLSAAIGAGIGAAVVWFATAHAGASLAAAVLLSPIFFLLGLGLGGVLLERNKNPSTQNAY